jgi:hypothetical protein
VFYTVYIQLTSHVKATAICTRHVKLWRVASLLRAHLCNDKNEYLYEDPGPLCVAKIVRCLLISNLGPASTRAKAQRYAMLQR